MASKITLNSSNIVSNGFNNSLAYRFSGSSVNFKNSEICVSSINLFYSQYNINASLYSNNTFSIIVPSGASTTTIAITLPDGYYSYSDLNNFIQNELYIAGAYLINGDGNNVFHFQLSENATYYAAQIDLLAIPTSLPASHMLPPSGVWSAGLPSTGETIRIQVNSGFSSIIGFSAATYPSSAETSSQAFLSNITPHVNPVSSYLLRCNLIHNPYSSPSDVISSFSTQGTTIGQLITYQPNEHSYMPIPDGSYANIQLVITDQSGDFVQFRDDQILIQLIIRERK